ncbi:MAG: RIP metalloprotease RseP [Candidatus Hydrogenedentota bacterium]
MIFNYLIAVFFLGILIFIHEFGHFIFAKLFKVKVEVFSLGFGPKLIGLKYNDTEYKISAVPFGGYVKMKGEDPNEQKTGAPDEFASKPVYQRIIIVIAGPLVNLIFGFLLFVFIYWVIGTATEGFLPKIGTILEYVTSAGEIKDVPAKIAGLKEGDEVLEIDNEKTTTFFDIQRIIRNSQGKELNFKIKRDGLIKEFKVKPEKDPKSEQFYVGFTSFEEPVIGKVIKNYPAYNAGLLKGDWVLSVNDYTCTQFTDVKREIFFSRTDKVKLKIKRKQEIFEVEIKPVKRKISTEAIKEYTGDTFIFNGRVYIEQGKKDIFISQIGIYPENRKLRFSLIKSLKISYDEIVFIVDRTIWALKLLITRKISLDQLAGPLGIIHLTGERAAVSIEELLRMVALLTISLWFINLIPIPVLDGGWIMFLLFESIFRIPVNPKIQAALQNVFFILLISLIIFVTMGDIQRWWGERTQLKESKTISNNFSNHSVISSE